MERQTGVDERATVSEILPFSILLGRVVLRNHASTSSSLQPMRVRILLPSMCNSPSQTRSCWNSPKRRAATCGRGLHVHQQLGLQDVCMHAPRPARARSLHLRIRPVIAPISLPLKYLLALTSGPVLNGHITALTHPPSLLPRSSLPPCLYPRTSSPLCSLPSGQRDARGAGRADGGWGRGVSGRGRGLKHPSREKLEKSGMKPT